MERCNGRVRLFRSRPLGRTASGELQGTFHLGKGKACRRQPASVIREQDGVRLAVSITRPSKEGKPIEGRFPILWQHTLTIMTPGILPKSQGGMLGACGAAQSLAYDGYIVVQVARRGQGPSFGKRRRYNDRSEAYDAYEVIDWLASQPWSTGAAGVSTW
jgi:predicted acyl esterase